MRERFRAPFELKEASKDGVFSGYAAVFNNIDFGDDVIEQGAFKQMRLTRDGMVRIAKDHDLSKLCGKAKVTQDAHGLYVEGQLSMGVSYVRDAYELMRDGVLDALSVGFDILPQGATWEKRDGRQVRVIKSAGLVEFSLVPFGMNPEALITNVKAASIRDFESQLRELGYSQTEAKALASGGFKSLGRRDGEQGSEMLADALKTLITL